MVEDKFSCVQEVSKTVFIDLPIGYHSNEIAGILDVLDGWKRQYIRQLMGIVTSYKNVSILHKVTFATPENPRIHCHVQATFELFTPTVGTVVKGRVNRISCDYIGCLVNNAINATIDCSSCKTYNVSRFISIDRVILFEITHLRIQRNIVRIKGKITQECINLMEKLCLSKVETDSVDQLINESPSSNEDTALGSSDEVPGNENQSQSLLSNNVDIFGAFSGSVSEKKKEYTKLQIELSPNRTSELKDIENEADPFHCLYNNSIIENSTNVCYDSQKKKKKSSKKKLQNEHTLLLESSSTKQNDIIHNGDLLLKEEITTDSSSQSPKKKKSSQSMNSTERSLSVSSTNNQNMLIEENSTDTSSQLSSSKKKKHKKSKADSISSPSVFSDSLSSYKEDIEEFKVPEFPSKEKHKIVQDTFSAAEEKIHVKDFASLLHDKDSPNSLYASMSLQKLNKSSEFFSGEYGNLVSSVEPTLEQQMLNKEVLLNDINTELLDLSKKPQKRKRESCEEGDLPKKKKKKDANKAISKQKSNKAKKKSKEKSKKDSKKGKKSRKKVISSKKKLPKLKKKKKEKSEKLKKKKSSKHKEKNVP